MKRVHPWMELLVVVVGGAALVHAAARGDDATPTYVNAQVVAVDVTGRTLVIRKATGVEEKVELDDTAGFGDIKAGDRVMLSLRTGPGWARVSSIVKGSAAPAPKVAASRSASPPAAPADNPQAVAREAFDAQVARAGGRADRVDRVWNELRSACSFKPGNPREAARGWFVVWEGSIRADLSGGVCRDLFNQIIDLGEPVKAEMTAAEDVARRTLSPGDIREIRRQYRMDWDGWALTAPKQLER